MRSTSSARAPGLVLGVGLGGFVDGILLHQVLQWHHMMSSAPGYPTQTVSGLQANTFWDGLFHIGTWIAVAVGTFLLFRRSADRIDGWALLGWIIAGWGIFDVVEGVVDHEILGIHHVRDDLGGPVAWDVGFLVFGLALVVIGAVIVRWAARRHLPDATD